jgi:predicted nucleic acid-binding protein
VITASSETVLLDTDVYSYLLNGSRQSATYQQQIEGKYLALSFISIGELYFGAYRKNWGPSRIAALRNSFNSVIIVPYDHEICEAYAEIRSALEAKGQRIEDNDTWIAACAVRHSIPLVSNNRSHFSRVPGLTLITASNL